MQLKVITIHEKEAWDAYVTKAVLSDIYHTHTYQSLDTSGEARLLVFEDERQEMMALPLIFRSIPGTDKKDVTSVYGYAGWIRTPHAHFPDVMDLLEDYLRAENVVSVFSRLHPFIPGADSFKKGNVKVLNTTTGVDLHLSPEAQFDAYSESVQRKILQVRRAGMTVRQAESQADLHRFIAVYNEAMKNLHASPHYFFSNEYFEKMWKNDSFECLVLLSEIEDCITGGAMFTICNGIMQYHLGAIVASSRHTSPLKLLIDEARQLANVKKCEHFHLGGGYGGQNNNLFIFKSRMTTLRYPFKVWQWVVDEPAYNLLSHNKKHSDFFPLYRNFEE